MISNFIKPKARAKVREMIGRLSALGIAHAARAARGARAWTSPVQHAFDREEAFAPPAGASLGAWLSALDWDQVRSEVDRESRARVLIAGARGVGKTTLVRRLIGAPVEHPVPGQADGNAASNDAALHDTACDVEPHDCQIEELGLFDLLDVVARPASADDSPAYSLAAHALEAADLVVWLLDATVGMRSFEHAWICRVRSTGRPVLVALNKMDAAPDARAPQALARALACPVIGISAASGLNVMSELLPRMADASPQLNTALGREVPAWRPHAARRITERATVLSGLVGLEPVPLLDIPFQALLQLRLVMRLAAIYGEPSSDRYSRELLATLAGSAALRYAGQQLAKVVPLLGWAASGALAAGGTWVIGKAAEAYFENGRRLPLPRLRR